MHICGDFNIYLSTLQEINNYQHYYNLLCRYGFLSLIQPTRAVENQIRSLIDNIYLNLSEHFCQFASINRGQIDIKKYQKKNKQKKINIY